MTSQSYLTEKKLFNAAIKAFAKKGYYRCRVEDIVNLAGVAKGTFYIYFKSKDECFKKILLTLHLETIENLKKSENIFEIINIFIDRVFEYKELTRVFLFEAISSGHEFRDLFFEFKKNFREVLSPFLNEEIKIDILFGFIRELIEQYILFENRDKKFIEIKIKKFMKFFEDRDEIS